MWKQILRIGLASSLLFFAACGKNEPITSTPPGYPYGGYQNPYGQAPMPPGGGYQMPPTGYQQPYFNPQMPPGMPPQYMPWLPIDNYFRQNPTIINVWVNVWNNWQNFAGYNGYNVYDFSTFWFDYCPQYYPQYNQIWNYFDTNVYWWVNQNTQFNYQQDPGYFWQYYGGMSYADVCGGGCYY